tara:strand:- start:291 stop:1727 length:1437 start_codon:yes stop_codon:yes gene_type:complete
VNNNYWTNLNNFELLSIQGVNFFTIIANYANLTSTNTFTQINNFNGGIRVLGSLFFGTTASNYINLNSIFGILDYVSENSHNFYVSSINIISIALNSITVRKKLIIDDNTLLNPTEGNLTLTHSASVGESSICFPSSINAGSDYGYIKFIDNYDSTSPGERSRLIIGVENDAGGVVQDAIILYSCNGTGSVGINNINPQESLDVTGNIKCSSSITASNITSTNIYGNNIFINGFNILDLLVAYARTSLNNTFSGINTFTGITTNFTNITVSSIISKVLTIYFGTIGEFYIGLNPNNGYFSYFGTGHAFYAESQGIVSISQSGLTMSNNKDLNATTINCTTLNCANLNITNQLLQNRMMFRIQNINNVMTIVYESDNTILVNYVQTNSKLKKIQVGSYVLSLNSSKINNNNYFISFNSTYNNSPTTASVQMNTSYTIKDDIYSNGTLYSKVCNITITRNSALSDILSNSQGYIEGLIHY